MGRLLGRRRGGCYQMGAGASSSSSCSGGGGPSSSSSRTFVRSSSASSAVVSTTGTPVLARHGDFESVLARYAPNVCRWHPPPSPGATAHTYSRPKESTADNKLVARQTNPIRLTHTGDNSFTSDTGGSLRFPSFLPSLRHKSTASSLLAAANSSKTTNTNCYFGRLARLSRDITLLGAFPLIAKTHALFQNGPNGEEQRNFEKTFSTQKSYWNT